MDYLNKNMDFTSGVHFASFRVLAGNIRAFGGLIRAQKSHTASQHMTEEFKFNQLL